MTYYGSKHLAEAFRTVRKNTITIAEDIPEAQYGFRAAPECRSVAQTLVHIAVMPQMSEQIHWVEKRKSLEGFDFLGFMGKLIGEEQTPRAKAEIVTMLQQGGDRFADWLEGLKEQFLAEQVTFPQRLATPDKSRFEMLMSVKEHEMHHRGQLMVMERMMGVVPHLTRDMQARVAQMQQPARGTA